jgi:hypothetical protein
MTDPNLETEKQIPTIEDLQLVSPVESSNIRLEGQALDEVLAQIDKPALIQ